MHEFEAGTFRQPVPGQGTCLVRQPRYRHSTDPRIGPNRKVARPVPRHVTMRSVSGPTLKNGPAKHARLDNGPEGKYTQNRGPTGYGPANRVSQVRVLPGAYFGAFFAGIFPFLLGNRRTFSPFLLGNRRTFSSLGLGNRITFSPSTPPNSSHGPPRATTKGSESSCVVGSCPRVNAGEEAERSLHNQ
jgi:hypothetical protein